MLIDHMSLQSPSGTSFSSLHICCVQPNWINWCGSPLDPKHGEYTLHIITLRYVTLHYMTPHRDLPVYTSVSGRLKLLFFDVCLFQLGQEPSHYSRLSWACLRTNVLPLVCRNSNSFHGFHIHIPSIRANLEDAIREEPQIYTLLTIFTLISLIFLGSLLIAQIAGMMRELGLNHQTQNSSTMFHMFRTC